MHTFKPSNVAHLYHKTDKYTDKQIEILEMREKITVDLKIVRTLPACSHTQRRAVSWRIRYN